jgi:hypothetical protein
VAKLAHDTKCQFKVSDLNEHREFVGKVERVTIVADARCGPECGT